VQSLARKVTSDVQKVGPLDELRKLAGQRLPKLLGDAVRRLYQPRCIDQTLRANSLSHRIRTEKDYRPPADPAHLYPGHRPARLRPPTAEQRLKSIEIMAEDANAGGRKEVRKVSV